MRSLVAALCLLATATSCSVKTVPVVPTAPPQITDVCFLPAALFGDTQEPTFHDVPPAHAVNPSDCPFYQPAWQEFLFATKPLPHSHLPAFLSYESFDDIFSKASSHKGAKSDTATGLMIQLEPRDVQRANAPSAELQNRLDASAAANSTPGLQENAGDTVQAAHGKRVGGTLIDQQGHFIYYAIHVNHEMAAFLRANQLTGEDVASRVSSAPPFAQLSAPAGSVGSLVEYKSSWMIVKDRDAAPNYFVTQATVPYYVVNDQGKIAPLMRGSKPRMITKKVWVALLGLHVVFTLPGHPEMIWSTFEHVSLKDGTWNRDNAPAAKSNPAGGTVILIDAGHDYPLYKANTPPAQCNAMADPAEMVKHWDENSQSFTKGGPLRTSVYRPYPFSKQTDDSKEDDDIVTVNKDADCDVRKPSLKSQGRQASVLSPRGGHMDGQAS